MRPLLAVLALAAGVSASRAEPPVERGRYLAAIAACTGCHTPRAPGAVPLSGGVTFGSGPTAAVSANVTPDAETGIGTWSQAQIVAALREGLRPDGTRIGPPMPQRAYAGLTDADAAAIALFLKSIPPVHNPVARLAERPAPARFDAPRERPQDRPRGRYLFEAVAHCAECHGAAGAPDASGKVLQSAHGPVVAPALTPALLASWSDAEIGRLVTTGLRPDGSRLKGPMPVAAYARLVPDDLAAIVGYLRDAKK